MWTIRQGSLNTIRNERQEAFVGRIVPYLSVVWPDLSSISGDVLHHALRKCLQIDISDELDVIRLLPILLFQPLFLSREEIKGILGDVDISASDRVDLLQEILMFEEKLP